jgi:hypothetical protein
MFDNYTYLTLCSSTCSLETFIKRENFFKLNDSMTVIIGGVNNRRSIVTFDWITMEYTEHNSTLIKERVRSSCSVVKNREGQKVVAIAGGATNTTGLEIWNPADDSVQLLYEFLPSEEGHKTEGLQDSRMVPINGD